MILHLILTSVLKELWCDKSFFLCLNKKLSLHFLNKVCMFLFKHKKNDLSYHSSLRTIE